MTVTGSGRIRGERARALVIVAALVAVLAGFVWLTYQARAATSARDRDRLLITQLQTGLAAQQATLDLANDRLAKAGEPVVPVPPAPPPVDVPAPIVVAGTPGRDGATGRAGRTGPRGPAGPAGPGGKAGSPGPGGQAGADGRAGPTGPAGPAGTDGKDGTAGAAGTDGKDGRGIRTVECSPLGRLTVTYTDDTTTDVGACPTPTPVQVVTP